MQLRKGQSLLYLSHDRNVADETESGWPSIVIRLLQTVYPELDIQVHTHACDAISAGSAEPLEALRERKPDWIVLSPITNANVPDRAADGQPMTPEYFKDSLLRLLRELSKVTVRVVIIYPFALDLADRNAFAPYEEAILDAVWEVGCMLVDAKEAIDAYRYKDKSAAALRSDIDLATANAFLSQIGFQWVRRQAFVGVSDRSALRIPYSS